MTVKEMVHRLRLGELIPFRRFMNTALYSSDGYYNCSVKIGGYGADFYTAALSPLFAFTMANAIVSAWHRLSCPNEFQVVEIGAGQGELALKVSQRLKKILPPDICFKYVIVEKSQMLINVQKDKIFAQNSPMVDDTSLVTLEWGLPSRGIDSVVIGNEVLDAFPVERVKRDRNSWKRSYISIEPRTGTYQEIWRNAPDWLCRTANQYLPIPIGQVSELCLSYPSFARQCATFGRRVEFILVDYGISKEELISGIRPDGTARGYRLHQVCAPTLQPGQIDMTSDVVWHMVEQSIVKAGFVDVSLMGQGEFLLKNNLLSVLSEFRLKVSGSLLEEMNLVGQFKQLVLPGGFGERFQVLTGQKFD